MSEVSATDAARNFSKLLDAIEHRGEHFTIIRQGRAIAQLEPAAICTGADVNALLRRHQPDVAWTADLGSVRELLDVDERP